MAQKTEEQAPAATEASEKDSPLLDLSDQSVKKLLKAGKARGYVTHDELNAVLPSEEVTPDQIEDTMAMLNDMGITVVEQEEGEEAAEARRGGRRPDEEEGRAVMAQSLPVKTETRAEPPSAPTIPCACTCARWARWSCSRARARSPLPSASRPAARR